MGKCCEQMVYSQLNIKSVNVSQLKRLYDRIIENDGTKNVVSTGFMA